MRIFITGTAGFIGFHLAARLLREGHEITGYDALTPYYDVDLKKARHRLLADHAGFRPIIAKLENRAALTRAVRSARPDIIIHLAAQAGVRYSLENPQAYIQSNALGSFNLIEAARITPPQHLLLASTSSVYGANHLMPFGESDRADHPMTLYAATKKSMEAMSHSYAHLWKLPTTVFRFFTVYGPWGRPDMALFKFVAAMLEDRPIEIYGNGEMHRDFTYVDDLVTAVCLLLDKAPAEGRPVIGDGIGDSLSPAAPWRVVNIAGGHPNSLLDFIAAIEKALGKPAIRTLLPMQKGDVRDTHADPALLRALTGYTPDTPIEAGVAAFVEWYRSYHASKTPSVQSPTSHAASGQRSPRLQPDPSFAHV